MRAEDQNGKTGEKDKIWSFFRPERSHWKRMQLTERRKLYPYTAVKRMDVLGSVAPVALVALLASVALVQGDPKQL